MRNKMLPVMYANYYLILSNVANDNGYALAVHGSMNRDFDLIAVAWSKERESSNTLIRKMCIRLGVIFDEMERCIQSASSVKRPWCRTYSFCVDGGGYVDINVVDGTSSWSGYENSL